MGDRQDVTGHYSSEGGLAGRLIEILEKSGIARAEITEASLHSVDQLHLRGRIAAEEFLDALGIRPGDKVLDVGCGLGGPSRMAAARYGADVSGIDLTTDFCDAARELNALVGLDDIRIEQGDALAMPFADDSFDRVFTLHVAMNIADKPALYREIARVLKPGGRFGLYDIVAGSSEPVHLPVPWASLPEHSHLIPAEDVEAAVIAAGFETERFEDQSALVEAYLDAQRTARQERVEKGEPEPPSGAPVIMGETFARKQKHIYRNLKEGRIAVRLGIFRLKDA
ncbi:methyltransferase domain-containing protein [Nisaea acidiphila]|uniref:Methyltransferase domain-containing protein n=1 Tax=Nisaea acidiphila TaxID=1862145 RepID=A0A9J7AU09_9PROT|nr:methyltransferase domain-containing protein [Nisaea acidiphila]UUX51203.1 methyltransferase domain-containing protein [Nisaea acidiphila]